MKSKNIKQIMSIAKAEKPTLKFVITIVDYIRGNDEVKSERRPGTKITCIDNDGNVFECDEVDESQKQPCTLSISVESQEIVDAIVKL